MRGHMQEQELDQGTTLIVPSIRESSFQRMVSEWAGHIQENTTIILVEDNPSQSFAVKQDAFGEDSSVIHYDWGNIDSIFGDSSWIIPRRSDTVRSFGYYVSSQITPRAEFIFTLDDDCYPEPDYTFLQSMHASALSNRTRWFNTLNSGKPRGIPFKNLGSRPVYVNHGLWTNVLDYDAPTQLVDSFEEGFTHDNRLVPSGQYFPMCGMNVAWRKEATVLMYHLLMGCVDVRKMPHHHAAKVVENCLPVDVPGYARLFRLPFDRFGDIWCGIIMKKICDHLGMAVSSGTPYVHHDRASDPFTNLVKEAEGIRVNEAFWEAVDSIELTGKTPADCYWQLGANMMGAMDGKTQHRWYFEMLGDAMLVWADLFR